MISNELAVEQQPKDNAKWAFGRVNVKNYSPQIASNLTKKLNEMKTEDDSSLQTLGSTFTRSGNCFPHREGRKVIFSLMFTASRFLLT